MKLRYALLPVSVAVLALSAGCADNHAVRPSAAPVTHTSSAVAPTTTSRPRDIGVSDDIARACAIDFARVDTAPKFDFDQASLSSQDRAILTQVARCLTLGPLKNRAVTLVGRADPRGEGEYNMALGEHRAGSALQYLAQLGVAKGNMAETSRGKLDAVGKDEAGWQRDRRVDVMLR